MDDQIKSFDQFCLKRILMNDTERKMIAVEGNFNGLQEPAVVVMEKYAFDEASVLNICNTQTKFEKTLENDIYKSYSCVPSYNGKYLNEIYKLYINYFHYYS